MALGQPVSVCMGFSFQSPSARRYRELKTERDNEDVLSEIPRIIYGSFIVGRRVGVWKPDHPGHLLDYCNYGRSGVIYPSFPLLLCLFFINCLVSASRFLSS